MADWSIDPGFHDEPTHVPTGDECSELCGYSDCQMCGTEVSARYCQVRSFTGLLWLAREVSRVQEFYGNAIPDGPVVIGDICADVKRMSFGDKALSAFGAAAVAAWAGQEAK